MMHIRSSVAHMGRYCLVAFFASITAFAQIGYPGQYPGGPGTYPGGGYPPGGYPPGGYPPGTYPGGGTGIPMPGGRHKKDQDPESLKDEKGTVTEIGRDHFAIETVDHRELTFAIGKDTKFTQKNETVSLSSMGIGQTVDVQARENDDETYTAVTVLLLTQQHGTPASTDTPSRAGDDNGPPVIHRGSSESSGATAPSGTPPKQPASDNADTGPATVVEKEPSNTQMEADDGGPPVLHRGKPRPGEAQPDAAGADETAAAAPATPVETASARIPPDDDEEGVRRTPSNGKGAAEFLETARETAEQFTENLPNFTCTEAVTRYYTESVHGTAWQPIDVVTTTVVYEGGRESYQNMTVDGKKADPNKNAAWSYGEFGTVLAGLFNPGLGASFTYRHDDEYNGFMSRMFDINVEQPQSNWMLHEGGQAFRPAYKGTVWIDKNTKRVVRIEMQAVNLPKTFPVDHAEMALDYQYVALGSHKFLVPVHSEVLMCHRGSPDCSKNVIDFRNYRKFGSESDITFGQ